MMALGKPSPRAPDSPLGLIPFVMPDWPDSRRHAESVDRIRQHGPVAWEIAVPSTGWSARTSDVIARALAESKASLDRVLAIAAELRPNVAVLYQGLGAEFGREHVLDRLCGKIDHVMLEWDAPDREAWVRAFAARGVGLVQMVDAKALTDRNAGSLCEPLAQGGILYVAWAPATGGETYSVDVLREAVGQAKSRRPDLYVMTGFGVRNAEQVRRLAAVEGLDAVAIGTALLERVAQGAEAVDAFFGSLAAAGIAPASSTIAEVQGQ